MQIARFEIGVNLWASFRRRKATFGYCVSLCVFYSLWQLHSIETAQANFQMQLYLPHEISISHIEPIEQCLNHWEHITRGWPPLLKPKLKWLLCCFSCRKGIWTQTFRMLKNRTAQSLPCCIMNWCSKGSQKQCIAYCCAPRWDWEGRLRERKSSVRMEQLLAKIDDSIWKPCHCMLKIGRS